MITRTAGSTLALAALSTLAACTPAGPSDPGELLEADRAYAAAVDTGGSRAWASWFAEDGGMVQPGVGLVEGRAEIRAFMATLDGPGLSLSWAPDHADMAASGDLGWTTGTYVARNVAPDGTASEDRGRYVSIWRKDEDGRWKVIMDLGNPTGAEAGV